MSRTAIILFAMLVVLVPRAAIAAAQEGTICAQPEGNPLRIERSVVADPYDFHGLASYLNNVGIYLVSRDDISTVGDEPVPVRDGEMIVIAGRFDMMVLDADAGFAVADAKGVVFRSCDGEAAPRDWTRMQKTGPDAPGGALDQVRYAHLWAPIAWIARGMEAALVFLHMFVGRWWLAIMLLAVGMRILFLPVAALQRRVQARVDATRATVEPELRAIKRTYSGEDAHERVLQTYERAGVSPFYTMKPLLFSFLQVPFLIGIFNALGEMSQLQDAGWLWIDSLAYPDAAATLGFDIPLFGDTLNMLPVAMTVLTLVASLLFKGALAEDGSREKRKLYGMAAFFFVLFYAFPAGMVLYWTVANGLHVAQQWRARDAS